MPKNSYSNYVQQPIIGGTPQDQKAHPDQVLNNAGGFVFKVTPWVQLDRFLILGSDSGSYYASAKTLTAENAKVVVDLLNDVNEDVGLKVVARIVEIAREGRAAKTSPSLFALALAMCSKHVKVRQAASAALQHVAGTPTMLFEWLDYVEAMRGRGDTVNRAIRSYYEKTPIDRLTMQTLKYRSRGGRNHGTEILLTHPKTQDPVRNELLAYIRDTHRKETSTRRHVNLGVNLNLPKQVFGYEGIKNTKNPKDAAKIIRDFRLTREMVPTELLKHNEVWEALLDDMPFMALVRNLGVMTANNTLVHGGQATLSVLEKLRNVEALRRSKLHPFNALLALYTYSQGHGVKGALRWTPISSIKGALNDVFIESFGNVPRTGLRIYNSLDVSGSMGSPMMNSPITCAMASAAMVMANLKAEGDDSALVRGFSTRLVDLNITSRDTIESATRKAQMNNFGGTDATLAFLDAIERYKVTKGREYYDAFCLYTDNETWAGRKAHPFEALDRYRQMTGLPVKYVGVCFSPGPWTMAQPGDAGCLDLVGFDASGPKLISNFLSPDTKDTKGSEDTEDFGED